MSTLNQIHYFGLVVSIVGFALLVYVDWRVAVGVFICLYGNNLTQS